MIPAGHPFREDPKHTIHQIRKKLCRWYGVSDADAWYVEERRRLMNACAVDALGLRGHETLEEYWCALQESARWADAVMAERAAENAKAAAIGLSLPQTRPLRIRTRPRRRGRVR